MKNTERGNGKLSSFIIFLLIVATKINLISIVCSKQITFLNATVSFLSENTNQIHNPNCCNLNFLQNTYKPHKN